MQTYIDHIDVLHGSYAWYDVDPFRHDSLYDMGIDRKIADVDCRHRLAFDCDPLCKGVVDVRSAFDRVPFAWSVDGALPHASVADGSADANSDQMAVHRCDNDDQHLFLCSSHVDVDDAR
jgi:hypothetical protein